MIGRGALHAERSSTVRSCGLYGRENAGMSSEKKVRILLAEYLRFPEQISFTLETLDIRPRRFSLLSRYSFRHSLFLNVHCSFRYSFFLLRMLLYQCISTFHGFGVVFQPRTFSAQDLSTSELLRTLLMYGCF